MECERRRIMNEIKENAIKRKFNIYKELYYGANSVFRTRLLLLLFPHSRFDSHFLFCARAREGASERERERKHAMVRSSFILRHREDVWILSTDINISCVRSHTHTYAYFSLI